MRVGSLFSGIGGFDLAARWMGWETAWFSEIDPYASKVLRKHWPAVPNHGDITKMQGEDLSPIDVLCGGFPCQDISTAGKGAGIEGTKSGLWKEYARLIGEIRPSWIVIENSPMLRSRGIDRVFKDITAFGYAAEGHCIPASAVGAPHQRDRIWIVAYPEGMLRDVSQHLASGACEMLDRSAEPRDRRSKTVAHSDDDDDAGERRPYARIEGERWRAGEAERKDVRREWEPRPDHSGPGCALVADALRVRLQDGLTTRTAPGAVVRTSRDIGWAPEPDVGRVAYGVPARVDRLRCLGNAVVPHVAYLIFQAIESVAARRA